MITQLNQQINSKQDELAFLNSKLNSMNIRSFQLQTTISLLNAQNEAQTAIIEKNKEALHRAYYIVGTSKDLQKEKIDHLEEKLSKMEDILSRLIDDKI